jgi:hypothetical protein
MHRLALLAATGALSACATQGIGMGQLREFEPGNARGQPVGTVDFRWHSQGASSTGGTITAVLPDGRTFRGWYREPTSTPETYQAAWQSQQPGPASYTMSGEPLFVGGSPADHQPEYSGRLLARLRGSDGSVMRCWFHLDQPGQGPAGGGQGDCSLPNGEVIEHVALTKAGTEVPNKHVAMRWQDAYRESHSAPACSIANEVPPVGIPAVVLDEPRFPGSQP